MKRLSSGLLFFSALVAFAPPAMAGPYEIYGAGARGRSMLAQTATTEGASSIFYNIGGLADSETGVSVGVLATTNAAEIRLADRPSGYDIPDLGADTPSLPSSQTVNARSDTDDIDALYGVEFGGVTSLGVKNFRAGIQVFLPTSTAVDLSTHYSDETERIFSNKLHFEFLDDRTRRLDIEGGVSYRITHWASVGLGGVYLPGSALTTNVYLPDSVDQSLTQSNVDVQTSSSWGLLAGAMFNLPENVNLGVAYRGPVKFQIEGENNIQITGLDPEEEDRPVQVIDWTPAYSPGSLSLGVSWKFSRFLLAADAQYAFYSAYEDTQSHKPNFKDTLSARVGLEHFYTDQSRVRMGVGYEPSPVPEQIGRTNYVDNDRILASVGSGHEYELGGVGFEVSWYLQVQFLVTQVVEKEQLDSYSDCASGTSSICDEVPDDLVDVSTGQPYPEAQGLQTENPGFPGYSSGGWIGALGLEVTF